MPSSLIRYVTYTAPELIINGTVVPLGYDDDSDLLDTLGDGFMAFLRACAANPIWTAIVVVIVCIALTFVPHVLDWPCCRCGKKKKKRRDQPNPMPRTAAPVVVIDAKGNSRTVENTRFVRNPISGK